jgi:tetratricopeptide (TPR) repeat protein
MSFDNYGNIPPARARELAEPHARQAISLAPDRPEGYAALGMVLADEAAIEPLSTAIRLDPGRAELRLWLAHTYFGLARQEEALKHVVAATEIDPLWAPAAWTHAYVLAASGMHRQSEAVIGRFAKRGGSPAIADMLRANTRGWGLGDYSEAVRFARQALAKDPETPVARQTLAWYYRILGLPRRAVEAGSALPLYSRLLLADDLGRLRSQVQRDHSTFWQQPDPDTAVEGLALLRDWSTLESLHDRGAAVLPTHCNNTRAWFLQQGIHLATALAARNRMGDANAQLACVKRVLIAQARGPYRTMFLSESQIHLFWAQIHALEGQQPAAFERLEQGVRTGIRTRYAAGLADLPAFDRYRGTGAYSAMDARLKQLIAKERAETLASA